MPVSDDAPDASGEADLLEFANADLRIRGERWARGTSRGQILLLHGGGQTRHSWGPGAARLAEHGWTCVAVDLRGHGDSDWAPDGEYDVSDHVTDVQAVCRELGGTFIIVGASLGGITAMALAARSPELVRALILVDIVPRPNTAGVQRIKDFMTAYLDGFDSLDAVGDAVADYTGRQRPRHTEGLRKNVRLREDGRWYWHWDPRMMQPFAREEPTPGIDADDILAAARNLRIPVALIRGAQSDVVSDDGVQELVDAIPDVRLILVDEAGHMVAGDSNEIFTNAVEQFLDSIGG